MIQHDDKCFERFGEVYFSSIKPNVIKGWNFHMRADMNMVCIVGTIQLVLYDHRTNSASARKIQEIIIGEHDYRLIHIPHGVAFSWKALDGHGAVIASCATLPYDPEELTKINLASGGIPYQWK
jgi:dTDP-4-dehydrorhamnose 3,5-epimerase